MIKQETKIILECDKNKLWEVVTNNKDYKWRSDLSKIEIVDKTHFIEYDKNNYATYFNITKKEKLKCYEFDIKNTHLEGKWSGKFEIISQQKIEFTLTENIKVNNL